MGVMEIKTLHRIKKKLAAKLFLQSFISTFEFVESGNGRKSDEITIKLFMHYQYISRSLFPQSISG